MCVLIVLYKLYSFAHYFSHVRSLPFSLSYLSPHWENGSSRVSLFFLRFGWITWADSRHCCLLTDLPPLRLHLVHSFSNKQNNRNCFADVKHLLFKNNYTCWLTCLYNNDDDDDNINRLFILKIDMMYDVSFVNECNLYNPDSEWLPAFQTVHEEVDIWSLSIS